VVAILNLGVSEILLIAVIAILVFGRNLPSAAVRAASTLQNLRRSLADLRRETGIDEELRRARREIEQTLPRGIEPLAPRAADRTLGASSAPSARVVEPGDPGAARGAGERGDD
jgi:Sec-independent protein translocase protein TatA